MLFATTFQLQTTFLVAKIDYKWQMFFLVFCFWGVCFGKEREVGMEANKYVSIKKKV
jgi:hypothetical protein